MSKSKRKSVGKRHESGATAAPLKLSAIVLPLLILCFIPAIFLVPYHFPPATPSDSPSWEFGFNNTVAQGLIAVMLLAVFGWRYLSGPAAEIRDAVARAVLPPEQETADFEPVNIRALLFTMGSLQMAACIILITWYSVLPFSHYGEITYFIQRTEAMIMGRMPYVDFAFDYGPALMALPVGIYGVFGGRLSVEGAYTIALIVHFFIGFALIAYVISQINARGRLLILAMIGFQYINLTMGLQYTPLRFTIALASLFAIRQILRLTTGVPSRRFFLAGLAAFVLPLINFSISPEMGVALSLSLIVYFLWFLNGPERQLAFLSLSVLAGVLATALIFPRPYFDSMLSFGKGGGSFPLFPTTHILAVLAAALWILPSLGILAIRNKSAAAPFCAALAIFCGLMIPPATGRCDPGHVWVNSINLLTIALAAISWLQVRWRKLLWTLYFLVFPFTNLFTFWNDYHSQIENAITVRNQLSNLHFDSDNYASLKPGDPRPLIHYSKLLPDKGLEILPQAKIGLPLGDNETIERFLKLTGRYVPEYHIEPYGDVFGPADLSRVYSDMRNMSYIYVPVSELRWLQPVNQQAQMLAQGKADDELLSRLLLFPVDLTPVHPLYKADADIMRTISQEYGVAQQYQSGLLLKRRD